MTAPALFVPVHAKISSFAVTLLSTVVLATSAVVPADAQEPTPGNEMAVLFGDSIPAKAPPRPDGEGAGPYERLVIRGATLIDGTGAPPIGPVDIVVERDRIAEVRSVGYPELPIQEQRRPAQGEREIDAHGMYVLPGLVDTHTHISTSQQSAFGEPSPAEYVFKLWLSHGVTSVRDVGSVNGLEWTLDQAEKSKRNEITAPRIYPYAMFPLVEYLRLNPEEAREWMQTVAKGGAIGVKFLGAAPDVMEAALDEAKKLGLKTTMHHAQNNVARVNVLTSARWGLTSMEHWYGLPEALFDQRTIQDYPVGYNYSNEQDRFGQAGRLWLQAAEPGSDHWNAVRDELIALDFTLSPTLTIYEASRDLMRARRAEWHDEYTWPTLWRFYQPNRAAHGAYWFYWTTHDEIAWKKNYARWMEFLNDYKNHGGRVTTGSDSGFIYSTYGFGLVRELELLQEAGFHPLEVVRAATLRGAELLDATADIGSVERGKKADLVIVPEDPLQNFKVLYATGAMKLDDETQQVKRVGKVKWTIKDGIVFDAEALRADVRAMVRAQKQREAGEPVAADTH